MIKETGNKITLRLYASLRDLLGTDRIYIDWVDNMNVGDLRQILSELFPILTTTNTQFTIAVNRRAVDVRKVVRKTDELAVLPPISGG